jgi:2-oxoglutarate ferredoxin oxidoreductase subunit alpha
MINVRSDKVEGIARDFPPLEVTGPKSGDLLVVSWGGTYGAVTSATKRLQRDGASVAHLHLRYLNPFPNDLGDVLRRYKKIMVPELNMGQLRWMLRARYLIDVQGLNKIAGQPFKVSEIMEKIQPMLGSAAVA